MKLKSRDRLSRIRLVLITVFFTAAVFFLVANLRNPQKKVEHSIESTYGVTDPQFARATGLMVGPPLLSGNRIKGLYNGDQIFPAMLAAIDGARHSITFESYIYWDGEIGRQFVEHLVAKARQGIKVHIVLDWVGSNKMDDASLERLKEAGIEVKKYHPLRWYNLSRLNYRTHRKTLVVDGRIGFTGGVGIGDKWRGNADSPDHWRDSQYQVEGPAVAQMQSSFMENWLKLHPEILDDERYFPELGAVGSARAQMTISSPGEGSGLVRILYLVAIAAARKSIRLASAYFIPDEVTIEALLMARKRGVKVQIIVPGPIIDTQVARKASRALWGPLLRAGVEIYEYQPTMFHCKVLIVDELWMSVGSTNFDDRSFRLNDESNLNVLDAEVATLEAKVFEKDLLQSQQVSLADWENRPWTEKALEQASSLLRSQL